MPTRPAPSPAAKYDGPQIDAKHPHYITHLPLWNQIDDCIAGEQKIKAARTKYLPMPNASDTSPANRARYDAYVLRAVFYNATGRTNVNLVGQCFAVPPVYTGPEELKTLLANIDGAGATADQLTKSALSHVTSKSRGGFLTDYPPTDGVVTKAQAEEGGIRAVVLFYRPQQIINWRTTTRGAEALLSLVVLEEDYVAEDDGFCASIETQWRVLKLEGGVYRVEVWRKNADGFAIHSRAEPRKGDGTPFDRIPFEFIGAETNSPAVEPPLLLDISNLNLGHYRNSADYEEMGYITGQATPYASGLNDSWVERHMKGGIQLGSRTLVPLPEGGAMGLLQAEANGILKEAMETKEAQMRSLGAKLVEKREVQRTATEAGIDEASTTSALASACNNVSAAFTKALQWAAVFQNITIPEGTADDEEESFAFELNTDFAVARMSPEERNANREDYNADLITFDEARDNLKGGGVAWLDNDAAKEEMEAKAEADFKMAQQSLLTRPAGPPQSPPAPNA